MLIFTHYSATASRYGTDVTERPQIADRIARANAEISRIEREIADYNAAARIADVERQIKVLDADGKVAAIENLGFQPYFVIPASTVFLSALNAFGNCLRYCDR